jgi:hypothetical protein
MNSFNYIVRSSPIYKETGELEPGAIIKTVHYRGPKSEYELLRSLIEK